MQRQKPTIWKECFLVLSSSPLPIGDGEKSGGNILTTEIVKKSLESGDLTEAQLVGDLVKASTSDFGPLVAMEGVKDTINQALIGIKDQLIKKFGGERSLAKGTKDGKPTAPRFYGRDTKHGLVPKAISFSTVPKCALPAWMSEFLDAAPPVQR